MICLTCGLQTLPEQKFCRSCGASLQITTQPLVEPLVEYAPSTNLPAAPASREGQRPSGLMLWGFILMFVGVAIGVISKKLLHQEIVTVVGILLSLLGMFLTVYPYLLPPPRRKHITSPRSQPVVLSPSKPPAQLPQGNSAEYLPSVTEATTDLLERSVTTAPRRKADDDGS
jgi:hypothetical protein